MLNISIGNPLKLHHSLTGNYHAICHYSYNLPIALLMGVWMFKLTPGKTTAPTIAGVIMLIGAVVVGRFIPGSALESWFTYDRKTLTLILAGYGFLASALPVWLLLSPRDYLSSFMKLGVIGLLAVGIVIVSPELNSPHIPLLSMAGE